MQPQQSTRKHTACTSFNGFSTSHAHPPASEARKPQSEARESTLHAASAKRMHVHASTSQRLRHVISKPASASSEHAAGSRGQRHGEHTRETSAKHAKQIVCDSLGT